MVSLTYSSSLWTQQVLLQAQMGTAGDTLGEVVFPTVPDDNAVIGFIIVNPTGTGDFVGGTSCLDDATIVPNVVYVLLTLLTLT